MRRRSDTRGESVSPCFGFHVSSESSPVEAIYRSDTSKRYNTRSRSDTSKRYLYRSGFVYRSEAEAISRGDTSASFAPRSPPPPQYSGQRAQPASIYPGACCRRERGPGRRASLPASASNRWSRDLGAGASVPPCFRDGIAAAVDGVSNPWPHAHTASTAAISPSATRWDMWVADVWGAHRLPIHAHCI